MKFLSLITLILPLATSHQGSHHPYDSWTSTQLSTWLKDHNVPHPSNLNTQQLRALVDENYHSIYDSWSEKDFQSWWKNLGGENSWQKPKLGLLTQNQGGGGGGGGLGWMTGSGDETEDWESTKQKLLGTLRRTYDQNWEKWDDSDLKGWCEDHGIITPPMPTHEQLISYVSSSFNTLSDKFRQSQSDLVSTWSESQLRDFLLMHGVVDPSSGREDLEVKARKVVDEMSKEYESWWSKATETVSNDWYAATEGAKSLGYDYVQKPLSDSKDYVWSTWDDNRLRSFLEENGLIKSGSKSTRDEMISKVKDYYQQTAENVYDTWSDNALRTWLDDHGVSRAKTAKQRDELLDLMSRDYYSASDTTYELWSDNQIRKWLEGKGLIEPRDKSSSAKLRQLIEENYYQYRDVPYQYWDDSMIKHYLQSHGIVDKDWKYERDEAWDLMKSYFWLPTDHVYSSWSDSTVRQWLINNGFLDSDSQAKRKELLNLMEEKYNTGKDELKVYFNETEMREWLIDNGYMTSSSPLKNKEIVDTFSANYLKAKGRLDDWWGWSDGRIRTWLRDNGVSVPASSQREELIQLMKENYRSSHSTLSQLMQSIQHWAGEGVHVAEDTVSGAYEMLYSAIVRSKHHHHQDQKVGK